MIQNANMKGEVFFGLHFCEGVAEYDDPLGGESSRIFITEDTIRRMGPTFSGRAVHVNHVNDDAPPPPDGYVVESFFNEADGRHWVKFMVTSQAALDVLKKGWTLSNAYRITNSGPGGRWHNVEYQQEVLDGVFTHMGIVPNPRYEESIVLTSEEFKAYNLGKRQQLSQLSLANSKGEPKKMNLKFWKRTAVENALDLENTVVTLPGGGEKTLAQLVADHDSYSKQIQNSTGVANGDSKVKVGNGDEMSVNQLVEKYNAMVDEKKNAEDEAKKKADEDAKKNADDEKAKKEAEEKKNAEDEAAKKKAEDEKQNGLKHFEALKNALDKEHVDAPVETSQDKIARGKARYGSNK